MSKKKVSKKVEKREKVRKEFLLGIIVALSIALVLLIFKMNDVGISQMQSKDFSTRPIFARFSCDSGKTIDATFEKESVMLSLSDGRNMNLSQTISADGARYADSNESFVFWNKGDSAFIQENNKTTYNDCKTPK